MRHEKTRQLIETAAAILEEENPMTVRQVYYQLVSRQENTRSAYNCVCNALAAARREGIIPWEWIEDRLRRPRHVSMWTDLKSFGETVQRSYRRDIWPTQSGYLEVWLEKDALSGIFEDVLDPYGVTLNVGRGYDGWSSIYNAAERYDGEDVTVLYFGDFDPSGEDMVRSLRDRLDELGSTPDIVKVALTCDDIEQYHLPPDFTKKTDTRSKKFIAKYGDVSVELDALPVAVLRQRLIDEVEAEMDMDALAAVKLEEEADLRRLDKLLCD